MAPVWKLNPAQVLGIAAVGIALGAWLKRKLPALDRWDIPVPVVGGMLFSLAALALRDRVVNLEADTMLRDLLMIAFMTTIGLSARIQLLVRGGAQVILLLALSSVGALLQNLLGIALAQALGLDPRLGILAGSVALAGGPATAVAFGGTFEARGVHGAAAAAMASATFGIAVAGLISGYVGGWLIRRRALRPVSTAAVPATNAAVTADSGAFDPSTLLPTVLVIAAAMGIGNLLSQQIERRGIILPAYIGAMIAAACIRNANDRLHWIRISQPTVDALGRIALYLFITMALLTLRLWELSRLALPLIIILAAQVALCIAMCVVFPFRIPFRRDYENAITSAGFCGYMLGITANAMASMEELVRKYGPAPESFLVVPVVGAFLIDFTNSLIITALANWYR